MGVERGSRRGVSGADELPNLLYQLPQPFGTWELLFRPRRPFERDRCAFGLPAQHEKAKIHHKVNHGDTKASSPDDLSGSSDVP